MRTSHLNNKFTIPLPSASSTPPTAAAQNPQIEGAATTSDSKANNNNHDNNNKNISSGVNVQDRAAKIIQKVLVKLHAVAESRSVMLSEELEKEKYYRKLKRQFKEKRTGEHTEDEEEEKEDDGGRGNGQDRPSNTNYIAIMSASAKQKQDSDKVANTDESSQNPVNNTSNIPVAVAASVITNNNNNNNNVTRTSAGSTHSGGVDVNDNNRAASVGNSLNVPLQQQQHQRASDATTAAKGNDERNNHKSPEGTNNGRHVSPGQQRHQGTNNHKQHLLPPQQQKQQQRVSSLQRVLERCSTKPLDIWHPHLQQQQQKQDSPTSANAAAGNIEHVRTGSNASLGAADAPTESESPSNMMKKTSPGASNNVNSNNNNNNHDIHNTSLHTTQHQQQQQLTVSGITHSARESTLQASPSVFDRVKRIPISVAGGSYKKIELLGAGAFAEVWLVAFVPQTNNNNNDDGDERHNSGSGGGDKNKPRVPPAGPAGNVTSLSCTRPTIDCKDSFTGEKLTYRREDVFVCKIAKDIINDEQDKDKNKDKDKTKDTNNNNNGKDNNNAKNGSGTNPQNSNSPRPRSASTASPKNNPNFDSYHGNVEPLLMTKKAIANEANLKQSTPPATSHAKPSPTTTAASPSNTGAGGGKNPNSNISSNNIMNNNNNFGASTNGGNTSSRDPSLITPSNAAALAPYHTAEMRNLMPPGSVHSQELDKFVSTNHYSSGGVKSAKDLDLHAQGQVQLLLNRPPGSVMAPYMTPKTNHDMGLLAAKQQPQQNQLLTQRGGGAQANNNNNNNHQQPAQPPLQQQQQQQQQQQNSPTVNPNPVSFSAPGAAATPGGIELRLASVAGKIRSERMEHESHILSNLAHPNVVGFIDQFSQASQHFLILEYVDGGDLYGEIKRRIKANRMFSESSIMFLFVQILMAIEYLHRNNIMHRDLKAENILLSKAWQVKITDFGLSKQFEDDVNLLVDNSSVGSLVTLAPEALQCKPHSEKSDVYSIGCILFEMIALFPPFSGSTLESIANKIVNQPPKALPRNDISQGLSRLVYMMLHKDPTKRPSCKQILNLPFVRSHVDSYVSRVEKTVFGGEPEAFLKFSAYELQKLDLKEKQDARKRKKEEKKNIAKTTAKSKSNGDVDEVEQNREKKNNDDDDDDDATDDVVLPEDPLIAESLNATAQLVTPLDRVWAKVLREHWDLIRKDRNSSQRSRNEYTAERVTRVRHRGSVSAGCSSSKNLHGRSSSQTHLSGTQNNE